MALANAPMYAAEELVAAASSAAGVASDAEREGLAWGRINVLRWMHRPSKS
jgi:hypothetical protein